MVWHGSEPGEGNQRSRLACLMSWSSGTNTAILLLITAPSLPALPQVPPDTAATIRLWVCYL